MTESLPSGQQLHQKFLALGNMEGKTSDEIVAAIGGPCTVIRRDAGDILMEWSAGGSRVRLNFDEQFRFVEVAHACIVNSALVTETYAKAPYSPDVAEPVRLLGVLVGAVVVLGLLINMLTMFT